jgi:hypothetical protein
VFLMLAQAVVAAVHLQQAEMDRLRHQAALVLGEMAAQALLLQFLAAALPMRAAVVVAFKRQHIPARQARVVLEVAQTEPRLQRNQLLQPPIRAVVAADRAIQAGLQLAARAAPALSSFPTLWRPALRSSLSPQQRGLHRPAQRRWITLS